MAGQKTKQTRTFNASVTSQLAGALQGKPAVIVDLKNGEKSFAPGLYDLTELQRDAHKRFGFPQRNAVRLQKLYEQHKLVTYPRTDSRFLSNDIVPTLKDRLEGMQVKPYAQHVARILKRGLKPIKLCQRCESIRSPRDYSDGRAACARRVKRKGKKALRFDREALPRCFNAAV
ncbi:DNA topoisomerase [Bacillus licheniformis]|nr:DNA topoisomerase [Bacillus licheniformis]